MTLVVFGNVTYDSKGHFAVILYVNKTVVTLPSYIPFLYVQLCQLICLSYGIAAGVFE